VCNIMMILKLIENKIRMLDYERNSAIDMAKPKSMHKQVRVISIYDGKIKEMPR